MEGVPTGKSQLGGWSPPGVGPSAEAKFWERYPRRQVPVSGYVSWPHAQSGPHLSSRRWARQGKVAGGRRAPVDKVIGGKKILSWLTGQKKTPQRSQIFEEGGPMVTIGVLEGFRRDPPQGLGTRWVQPGSWLHPHPPPPEPPSPGPASTIFPSNRLDHPTIPTISTNGFVQLFLHCPSLKSPEHSDRPALVETSTPCLPEHIFHHTPPIFPVVPSLQCASHSFPHCSRWPKSCTFNPSIQSKINESFATVHSCIQQQR